MKVKDLIADLQKIDGELTIKSINEFMDFKIDDSYHEYTCYPIIENDIARLHFNQKKENT